MSLSDNEFERQFALATLDPTLFTHEAHLRLAWVHINKYGEAQATQNICSQIQQFDRIHDKGRKYNTTVTIAAVKIVNHFINKSDRNNFTEFIQDHPRLINSFLELIKSHYSIDIFNDEEAKLKYVEPDLSPFE